MEEINLNFKLTRNNKSFSYYNANINANSKNNDQDENIYLNNEFNRHYSISYKMIKESLYSNYNLILNNENITMEGENIKLNNISINNNILQNLDNLNKVNIHKKKSYTIKFKIAICDFLLKEKNKLTDIELKQKNNQYLKYKNIIMLRYEIPKNTLNDWLKNYDKYKNSKNVLRKKLPGGGRKGKLLEYEQDLI